MPVLMLRIPSIPSLKFAMILSRHSIVSLIWRGYYLAFTRVDVKSKTLYEFSRRFKLSRLELTKSRR